MLTINISKKVLRDTGWHIQKSANAYDYSQNIKRQPYVVGDCPKCDAQRTLKYIRQTPQDFVFKCSYCN